MKEKERLDGYNKRCRPGPPETQSGVNSHLLKGNYKFLYVEGMT
jgi:hypothetical protein